MTTTNIDTKALWIDAMTAVGCPKCFSPAGNFCHDEKYVMEQPHAERLQANADRTELIDARATVERVRALAELKGGGSWTADRTISRDDILAALDGPKDGPKDGGKHGG